MPRRIKRKRQVHPDEYTPVLQAHTLTLDNTVPNAPFGFQYGAKYVLRDYQQQLGKKLCDKLYETNFAHLKSPTGTTKTLIMGISHNMLRHRLKKETGTGKRMLVVNILETGGSDAHSKCCELGATIDSTMFMPTSPKNLSMLQQSFKQHNYASIVMNPRQFIACAGGQKRGRSNWMNLYTVTELQKGVSDLSENDHGPKESVPWLATFLQENEVEVLLLSFDEAQYTLSQTKAGCLITINGLRAIGEATWFAQYPRKGFQVKVMTASAEPHARSTSISRQQHIANMAMLTHKQEIKVTRSNLTTIYDEHIKRWDDSKIEMSDETVDNIDVERKWLTGATSRENRNGGILCKTPTLMLSIKEEYQTLAKIRELVVMTALMQNLPGHLSPREFNTGDSCVKITGVLPPKKDRVANHIYLTPTLAKQYFEASQSIYDASLFIRGEFISNGSNSPSYNPKGPKQVQMRKVVNLLHDNNKIQSEQVGHYHFVLVVVPDSVSSYTRNMIVDLDAVCCNAEVDLAHHTAIYNLMDWTEIDVHNKVESEIRNEFYKNERMVMCVVNEKTATGTNIFGDLVTCTAVFGLKQDAVSQACGRSARDTNPQVGKIYPNQQEYLFLMPCSSISGGLRASANPTNWKPKLFDNMVSEIGRSMLSDFKGRLLHVDNDVANFVKKFFFDYSTPDKHCPIQFLDIVNDDRCYTDEAFKEMIDLFFDCYEKRQNGELGSDNVFEKTLARYMSCYVNATRITQANALDAEYSD